MPLGAGGKDTIGGRKTPSGATPAHHVRTQGPSVREEGPLGCYPAHHMLEERPPSCATPAHHVREGSPWVATVGVLKKSVPISDISVSTGREQGF
ncbi:hypothetical protein V6N12_013781 [Hibiscus sabdariffa]|uniref:Uncharacterized protein n=1 Tax=Hibiscus sabdariffa TaxID=183260 RepID=A0ABR2CV69_9ROSI